MRTIADIVKEARRNKKIYDFTSFAREKFIKDVKRKFILACKKDNTLDDEYKNFIIDEKNISVNINYGWNISVLYRNLTINVDYDYKDSYKTTTHETHDVLVIKDGSVSKEKITTADETWNTDTFHANEDLTFYSSQDKQYKAWFTDVFSKDGYSCVLLKDTANISEGLKKALNYKMDVTLFKEYMNDNLPSGLRDEVRNKITNRRGRIRNFKINKISDYDIEKAYSFFMPSTFDITVVYKNETYTQTEIAKFENVSSMGAKSEHFNKFEKDLLDLKYRNGAIIIPRVLAYLGYALPLAGFILAIILGDTIGANFHRFRYPLIIFWFFLTVTIVFCGIKYLVPLTIRRFNYKYTPDKSNFKLRSQMKRAYVGRVFLNHLLAVGHIALCALLGYLIWFV